MSTVSVVIATYNRGPRIADTLDSVLAQTRPATEVVMVDDCSPDGTGDWVRANYPAVRVVRPERNGGTSAARNLGARAATGDVLVFLDHDDLMFPHAIETLAELLRVFPDAQAAYADHRYTNTVTGERHPNHHADLPSFHRMRSIPAIRSTAEGRLYGRPMFLALLHGNLLQQPWAIRRWAFEAVGGFAEEVRYCEDWDLYLRVAQRGQVAVTDRVISDHIVGGENLHLAAGQEEMHQRVIRRLLRSESSPEVRWVLKRRLGMYLKTDADRAALAGDPRTAWRYYLRSFAAWPFDAVVAVRALAVYPVKAAFARRAAP
jgi:glycosyltransferase involved in cell wall biosynthesis